jgi:hypothetical protein
MFIVGSLQDHSFDAFLASSSQPLILKTIALTAHLVRREKIVFRQHFQRNVARLTVEVHGLSGVKAGVVNLFDLVCIPFPADKLLQ